MKKKYNTKLFSSGAEFLVLAKLLLSRIETYLAYENQEGYDLISINAKKNLSTKDFQLKNLIETQILFIMIFIAHLV